MFIWNDSKKRCNIYADLPEPVYDSKGFEHRRPDTQEIRDQLGIVEIPDPARGNDETQYTTEIDAPPYVVITDKPEWMVTEANNGKINAQIAALEQSSLMPRASREVFKALMEREASAQGFTPNELYQANPGYRKLIDLDKEIADLRKQIKPVVKPEGV